MFSLTNVNYVSLPKNQQHKAKFDYFRELLPPIVPFAHQGDLPKFKSPSQTIVFKAKTKGKTISAGRNFLLDQINHMTTQQIEQFLRENPTGADPVEFAKAIRELKFYIRKDGEEIEKGEPILAIEGNPLAIVFVKTIAQAAMASMTAKASYARELIDITEGYKTETPNLKSAAFAYFGLRRGDTSDRSIDEAAVIGGFNVVANTNAFSTAKELASMGEFAPTKKLNLTGTTAHAFVTYLTSILMKAEKSGKVEALFKSLNLPDTAYKRYLALRSQEKPDCGIYDFFSFCVYTQAVIELGKGTIVYLVDTTDTELGVKAAIEAATLMGKKDSFTGVRIDTDPKNYIKLVADLYFKNNIPDTVKIYCTDGIDDKSIREIYEAYAAWLKQHPTVKPWPLVFGIGSSVANKKPLALSEEVVSQVPESLKAAQVQLPKDAPEKAREQNDVNNYHETLPCDAYSCIQWALIEHINQNIRKGEGLDAMVPQESVAALHFRHRPNTPNYLIVAGVNAVMSNLRNFTFNDEMIERMKATNAAFSDEFYNNLRGKKLNVRVSGFKDGEIASPYQPVMTVSGDPGHVLFVESYILSTIGSMSAKAAKAREVIDSLGFTEKELQDDNNLVNACRFYVLDEAAWKYPERLKQMNEVMQSGKVSGDKQALINFLRAHFEPIFSYSGLAHQNSLNDQAAEAAKLGGFSQATHPQTVMGFTREDKDNVVVIEFDESELYQLSDLIREQKLGEDKKLHLRFDIPDNRMHVLRSQLIHAGIKFDRVTFITGKSIAQEENLKGTVYKGTASIYANNEVEYCLKAGGAKGKPDVKTSVPGAQPISILLKDASGKAVGTLIADRNDYSSELSDSDLIQAILNSQTVHYYQRNTKQGSSVIAVGQHGLDFATLKGEMMTTEPLDIAKAYHQFTVPSVIRTRSDDAALQVRQSLNHDSRHDLPVYMEKGLYDKMCSLIRGDAPVVKAQTSNVAAFN